MNRIALTLWLASASLFAQAGTPPHAAPRGPSSVPALDEIGLLGLAIVVGLAAGWLIKRKK